MIPAYSRSVSSLMPLDLNQDQNHELLFSPNRHSSSSSSPFSSLSYPILFNSPDQNQEGSHYCEPRQLSNIHEEAEKIIPSSGSCDHSTAETEKQCESRKVTVWRKDEATTEDGSLKWMSSKMRMMRKMMVSDQGNSMQQNDQKQPLSPLGTDNSSSSNNNYYSNNTTVRVCADCHTTKTPLWRSGPRGPKSLCNACGIRQRKARRAMAAAAAATANGTILMATETSVKRNKLQKKEKKKKSKIESPQHMKKKHNLEAKAKPSKSKKKFGFEDLTLRLSKNLALQKVFPQDEKEAAILLMALSYGLVLG